MKSSISIVLIFFFTCFIINTGYSQGEDTLVSSKELHKVTKNDGTSFIGYILKNDAREILIQTEELGEIYIPKHEIKSIEVYDAQQEELIKNESTRNVLTRGVNKK